MLAAKGVTLDREGKMVRLPNFIGPDAPTDQQLRYHNERRGDYTIESRQRYNWVSNLTEIIDEIERHGLETPWPYFSVFWTRLHGLISEMRGEWLNDLREAGVDVATHIPNAGSLLEGRLALVRAVEAVLAVFTDDERIYADYRRQTEGHPTQRSYAVRWNRKTGQVNDQRTVPTVGRSFTVDELDEAVRRVFAQHPNVSGMPNEAAIAVAFARRVRDPLRPVLAIIRRDFVPA